MEFFMEGTRSRSGKSLHPRLGRQIRTFLKLECCRSMGLIFTTMCNVLSASEDLIL